MKKKITDYDHDKYITTPEINKVTGENLAAMLAQENSVSKSDIANFGKKTDFDNKLKIKKKKKKKKKESLQITQNMSSLERH